MKKFNSRGFPFHRGRRLRSSSNLRDLVAETFLKTDDLVMPYFIREDNDKMDSKNKFGFKRFSINELLKELDEVVKLGIKSVALFPKIEVEKKTDDASEKRIGVVAQEIETVCPKLVDEVFDKDDNGNLLETSKKSVKYSVLYMKAIKCLQEAQARIETLESKVATLEGS